MQPWRLTPKPCRAQEQREESGGLQAGTVGSSMRQVAQTKHLPAALASPCLLGRRMLLWVYV